ncbi:MAG: sulfite exporter TauE/SafE family protein [Gammaproteobacteria bacterium]|nr:sulfite exporter TauE/SafE family protein [Gammaproteobacteria bacterium]
MTAGLLIAGLIAVVAGLMRGFAGVGSGMLMAPIFAIVFGPVQTVVIIVLMEAVVTAQLLPSVYQAIDWRVIGPMALAAAMFLPLGSWVLTTVDAETMTRVIATIVLILALVLLGGWRYAGPKRLPTSIGIGALSGTMMAATSLGNPPVMLYLLSSGDAAAIHRANFTGYFAVTLTALLSWMGARGLVTGGALWRAALLLPVFMLAAWLGARMFRASSEAWYRRVALTLLLMVGLYGVLR